MEAAGWKHLGRQAVVVDGWKPLVLLEEADTVRAVLRVAEADIVEGGLPVADTTDRIFS